MVITGVVFGQVIFARVADPCGGITPKHELIQPSI